MSSITTRLYATLVEDEEDHGCRDLPDSACREVPGNAGRLVAGFTLQKLADRIVDAKTVLAWLLSSLGAPGFTIAMLVPIREAGSLLPQAALIPFVRKFQYRKRVWAIGSAGQGIAAIGIGGAAAFLTGLSAGLVILGLLVDLGSGDARTRYVAVSNTVVGALLLFTGVVSAVVAEMGTELVLAGFAVLGLVGSMAALRMEEIQD